MALADLPRLAALGLTLQEVALILAHRLQAHLPFATAAVYVPRAADDWLEPVHVSGLHGDVFRHSTIRLGEGLSGWVAAHGQYILNGNPALDLIGPVASCEVPLSSALVVPVTASPGGRGALALYAVSAEAFTPEHARLAITAALHLSRAFSATAAITPSRTRAA